MSTFTVNSFPIFPGAYVFNIQSITFDSIFPIYGSIANYTTYKQNNDDYYLVLPGFKLVVYNATTFTTAYSYITMDNTNGTTIKRYTLNSNSNVNAGLSCKLYNNNTEINNVYE